METQGREVRHGRRVWSRFKELELEPHPIQQDRLQCDVWICLSRENRQSSMRRSALRY